MFNYVKKKKKNSNVIIRCSHVYNRIDVTCPKQQIKFVNYLVFIKKNVKISKRYKTQQPHLL